MVKVSHVNNPHCKNALCILKWMEYFKEKVGSTKVDTIYLTQNSDKIHQFLLTKLSLINRTG